MQSGGKFLLEKELDFFGVVEKFDPSWRRCCQSPWNNTVISWIVVYFFGDLGNRRVSVVFLSINGRPCTKLELTNSV